MQLKAQKRLAAQVLKCSPKKVWIDPTRLDEVKESITKNDIKALVNDHAIVGKPKVGSSKSRIRKNKEQKRKGRRRNFGSRKGTAKARLPKKGAWMNKIKKQRTFLKELKEKNMLDVKTYRNLYLKAKGGFFRNKQHLKYYINEHNLVIKK